jgi:excisionase family DNA binding protein
MKFYTTSEVATILGISKGTAVGLCNDGLLKAVNIGRCNSKRKRWRISEESLEAFVRDRANPTAKEKQVTARGRLIQRPVRDYFA